MALVIADRVQETTTTTGTGTVTLAGAVTGYQSFSAIGNTNTTYYTITDPATGAWEVGLGTYTASGTTLSRTTVLASSNAGSLVSFGAGNKFVFSTYPAEKALYEDASGNVGIGTASPAAKLDVFAASGYVDSRVRSNTSQTFMGVDSGTAYFGTYSNIPVVFTQNNSEKTRIDTSGNFLLTNSTGALGYGTGSGGTVTQLTSRLTAVTLNKPTGQITMFSAAGSATWQIFQVNNSLVTVNDTVVINHNTATNNYIIIPQKIGAGFFTVWFYAITGVAVDAPKVNFSIIKGAVA